MNHEIQEGAQAPMLEEEKDDSVGGLRMNPRAHPSINLLATADPKLWAKEFMERVERPDEELMIIWFSNALITGYDKGLVEQAQRKP